MKRHNSSFAVPSGFAFSARVASATRAASAATKPAKKKTSIAMPDGASEPVAAPQRRAA